jgi:hypothetical protein
MVAGGRSTGRCDAFARAREREEQEMDRARVADTAHALCLRDEYRGAELNGALWRSSRSGQACVNPRIPLHRRTLGHVTMCAEAERTDSDTALP